MAASFEGFQEVVEIESEDEDEALARALKETGEAGGSSEADVSGQLPATVEEGRSLELKKLKARSQSSRWNQPLPLTQPLRVAQRPSQQPSLSLILKPRMKTRRSRQPMRSWKMVRHLSMSAISRLVGACVTG